MSIVAHVHPYVVGVDTHARHHVYSVLVSSTGELLGSQKSPTTEAGLKRAMRWVVHRTRSHVEALWVIEGTSSYGAVLTGMVLASDFSVAEAPRVDSQHRTGVGKTDELDSARIARAALGLPVDKLRRPRLGKGIRQAIRILVASGELLAGERTRKVNALTALVRGNPLGIDARGLVMLINYEKKTCTPSSCGCLGFMLGTTSRWLIGSSGLRPARTGSSLSSSPMVAQPRSITAQAQR